MLVPIGGQLVNEDDVLYIIQEGPDKIRVEFRGGQVLNIETKDPQGALRQSAEYIAHRNA